MSKKCPNIGLCGLWQLGFYPVQLTLNVAEHNVNDRLIGLGLDVVRIAEYLGL